jgi:hypothetical protein
MPVLFMLLWTCSSGCHLGRVNRAECTELLDKYIGMVIGADPALANLPPDQARAVREMKAALKRAEKSYAQVESQCEAEVTRAEYKCAMKAGNADEWEACIQ